MLSSLHVFKGRAFLAFARRCCWAALPVLLAAVTARAQHAPGYNYDEANIPPYTLLDPLQLLNGKAVTKPQQWVSQRRPEILHLFEENIFGRTPEAARRVTLGSGMHAHVIERDEHALGGLAVREQVDLTFDPAPGATPPAEAERTVRLLLYVPATHRPAPVVLGLNFTGNQSVLDDPAIQPTALWSKPKGATSLVHALPAESTRGAATQQWQVRLLLEHGYGLATMYYGDLEPDLKDADEYSVRQLFRKPEQKAQPDDWGAIGAWAWGLSRAMDFLSADPGMAPLVDKAHVAVTGHSRLGKAVDWAVAQDTRFAALLSTESGHGGQSIQRRALGETVAHLQHSFPYWFCPAYAQWVDHDAQIPVDGNLLLSLIAPRPLYVASAVGDEWSDPKGEFLAAVSASRVYSLLGKPALAADTPMPTADQPVGLTTFVAYHDRAGKHDVTRFDWEHYIAFLDHVWGKPGVPVAPGTQR